MTMRDQCDGLYAAYVEAVEAGNADAIARLYTEDALILTPGLSLISGRQAIQENHKESMGNGYKLTIKIQDFQSQGDISYAVGTYETEDGNGKFLDVIQRQNDGSLLLHRTCTNSN